MRTNKRFPRATFAGILVPFTALLLWLGGSLPAGAQAACDEITTMNAASLKQSGAKVGKKMRDTANAIDDAILKLGSIDGEIRQIQERMARQTMQRAKQSDTLLTSKRAELVGQRDNFIGRHHMVSKILDSIEAENRRVESGENLNKRRPATVKELREFRAQLKEISRQINEISKQINQLDSGDGDLSGNDMLLQEGLKRELKRIAELEAQRDAIETVLAEVKDSAGVLSTLHKCIKLRLAELDQDGKQGNELTGRVAGFFAGSCNYSLIKPKLPNGTFQFALDASGQAIGDIKLHSVTGTKRQYPVTGAVSSSGAARWSHTASIYGVGTMQIVYTGELVKGGSGYTGKGKWKSTPEGSGSSFACSGTWRAR